MEVDQIDLINEQQNKKRTVEDIEEPNKKQRLEPNDDGIRSPGRKSIKVIPPKSPNKSEKEKQKPFTINMGDPSEQAAGEKLAPPSAGPAVPPSAPPSAELQKKEKVEPISPKKITEDLPKEKPTKESIAKSDKTASNLKVSSMLEKMQFRTDRSAVLTLIQNSEKKNLVVTDSRLSNASHPNHDVFLGILELFTSGHVIYTGAKSRSSHSNRSIDLDLFLCPQFTAKDHFATIQVRIPSEFLTYRGNVAVRKSALWGTDVYTDDSDVVAGKKTSLITVVIHSGHYQPVDAPDSKSKAAQISPLALNSTVNQSFSSVIFKSEIQTQVIPVIAQADRKSSSSTILVPDHDLYVILRILPRLVKYSGSNRFGLDSKYAFTKKLNNRGWGSSHDGESFQVVAVEKVERGAVLKQGRKTFTGKGHQLSTSKSIIFSPAGQGL